MLAEKWSFICVGASETPADLPANGGPLELPMLGFILIRQANSLIPALGCVYLQFTVFVSLSIHVLHKPDG